MRLALLVLVAGCGRLGFEPVTGDAMVADGAIDAAMLGSFGTPVLVSEVSGVFNDDDPSATADLLELYFASDRDGPSALYVVKRTSTAVPWGAPAPIAELNTGSEDTPGVSPDGLTLWFDRDGDIYVSKRADRTSLWGPPEQSADLTVGVSGCTRIAASLRRMLLCGSAKSGRILLEAVRATSESPWQMPVELELPKGGMNDYGGSLLDDLTMIYSSTRPEGLGQNDLYLARRATVTSAFTTLERLDALNSIETDDDAWLSPDGRTLLMSSRRRDGSEDIFISTR